MVLCCCSDSRRVLLHTLGKGSALLRGGILVYLASRRDSCVLGFGESFLYACCATSYGILGFTSHVLVYRLDSRRVLLHIFRVHFTARQFA
jgi:hypothetical protein